MSETTKKTNVKKIVIAVIVFAAIAVLFGVIYAKFAPKANAGTKNITIEVVDDAGVSKMYSITTKAEYLGQAIAETEGLTVEGEEGPHGLMVNKVNGVVADYNVNQAYWAFYVDGEYCNYGIDEQPLENGQAYQIIYTK